MACAHLWRDAPWVFPRPPLLGSAGALQGIVLLGVFLRVLPRSLGAMNDVIDRIAPAIRKYVGERGGGWQLQGR